MRPTPLSDFWIFTNLDITIFSMGRGLKSARVTLAELISREICREIFVSCTLCAYVDIVRVKN